MTSRTLIKMMYFFIDAATAWLYLASKKNTFHHFDAVYYT